MGDAAAKARDEGIKETNRQFELAKEEQGTAEERYKVARKDKVVATVPKVVDQRKGHQSPDGSGRSRASREQSQGWRAQTESGEELEGREGADRGGS